MSNSQTDKKETEDPDSQTDILLFTSLPDRRVLHSYCCVRNILTDSQTDSYTDRWTETQTSIPTLFWFKGPTQPRLHNEQSDNQTNKQTDRQTHRQTCALSLVLLMKGSYAAVVTSRYGGRDVVFGSFASLGATGGGDQPVASGQRRRLASSRHRLNHRFQGFQEYRYSGEERLRIYTDGRTNGWMDGWMDGRMDGRTDGRMDGRTDE